MNLPASGHVLLPELGVVRVSGADASTFLQGQLTADVRRVSPTQAALAAWCNPQGRALFLMQLLGTADGFLLVLPADDIERFVKRLRMFVLRAKVTVEDLRAPWGVAGVLGLGADAQTLAGAYATTSVGGVHRCRLPGAPPRALVLGETDALQAWLDAGALPSLSAADWWALDAQQAQPRIDATTAERFIPQQLNLDRLGMMSFDKGCYPGQEVIARLKYRGTVKARLRSGQAPFALSPGARLYAPGAGGGQSAGEVLNVVPVADGVVFTAVIDLNTAGALHANTPDGPVLTLPPDPGD